MANNNKPVDARIAQKVYQLCFEFAARIVGTKKTRDLFQASYQTILAYLHVLSRFQINDDNQLLIADGQLDDKEILSFAVWMQQFIREFKNFMVGLGKLEIEDLTVELKKELEEIGFYEFYHQAQELDY